MECQQISGAVEGFARDLLELENETIKLVLPGIQHMTCWPTYCSVSSKASTSERVSDIELTSIK